MVERIGIEPMTPCLQSSESSGRVTLWSGSTYAKAGEGYYASPTINLDNPAVETPIDLAPNAKREREINVALNNSFGFGGTNASLLFGRVA